MSSDELRSAARRWRAAEHELRWVADRVAVLEAVPWRSVGAGHFRDRVRERAAMVQRLARECSAIAGQLEELAGQLDAVVVRVESRHG